MNITLNNFLSQLKNTSLVQKENLILNFNKSFLPILHLLYNEGVILTYTNTETKIIIKLRYHNNLNNLKYLKVMSTATKPLNLNKFDILKIYEKDKLLVFSTPKGILTSLDCKKKRIGGELLFML